MAISLKSKPKSKSKCFLVTTPLESSWHLDDYTIFLGEWCQKPDRKKIWSSMSSELAKPYGLNYEQRIADIDECHKFYEILIKEIARKLNGLHKTNHSVRYWTILIGPWLNSFILVVLNRYKTLEAVLKTNNISETTLLIKDGFDLTSIDYSDFRGKINCHLWNNILYVDLLSNMKGHCIKINVKNIDADPRELIVKKFNVKVLVKKLLLKFINWLQYFNQDTDAFIINSYLPLFEEMKLNFSLGQFPLIYRTENINTISFNQNRVAEEHVILEFEGYVGVERELRRLVNKLIPKVYVEGYKSTCSQVAKLKWPSRPKFIYTANNFTADELFKFWLGIKVEEGFPYYTGQHGANYGTFYGSKNWPELNTADRFYSWGWETAYETVKCIAAFNYKIINQKVNKFNKNGKLFLVERSPGTRDGVYDRFHENSLAHQNMVACSYL